MNRRFLATGLLVALVGGVLVAAVAGGGGDDDPVTTTTQPVITTTSQPEPITGGLEVPELPNTYAAPIPSLGFGVAVPEGWQSVVLSEEGLARIEDAVLADDAFAEAAFRVAAAGAIFYAAGVDQQGRVDSLEVQVIDVDDQGDIEALAAQIAESPTFEEVEVVGDAERVEFAYTAPNLDDEDQEIDVAGAVVLVPELARERVWLLTITTESSTSRDALVELFAEGFVLADP